MEAPGSPGAALHAPTQRSQDPRCSVSPELANRSTPDSTRRHSGGQSGGTKVLDLVHILAPPARQAGARPPRNGTRASLGEPNSTRDAVRREYSTSPGDRVRRTARVEH